MKHGGKKAMNEFHFNVTGAQRKTLVGAISELTNSKITYNGAPSFSYDCGGYHIDKTGLVTGEYDRNLFAGLAERGFEPEISPISADETDEPDVIPVAEETPNTGTQGADSDDIVALDCELPQEPEETAKHLTVEVPNDFTPEQLDNIAKMTAAKEPLLKKALGAEKLPIRVTEDKVAFPWFTLEKPGDTACYIQFIAALCNTAKEKKRITAKAPGSGFENERFTMRIWLIGLGLVGKEYGNTRKLLLQNLTGNAAWRYGAPDKKTAIDPADGADTGEESPAVLTAPAEEETAPAADTGADVTEEAGADHE